MNQQQPMIRKPLVPPPHIAYAHKLGRGLLTFEQIDQLVLPINQAYVMKKQNNSYLSQHQARAEMNRIFGYGNWSSNVLSMELEYEERMHKDDNPKHPNFPPKGQGSVYWISCYKARVEVEIRDLWGMPVTSFSEFHIEENAPQPNRGEARALAATSVESYALRRALIGLGDRLGLGLYNKGSMAAHGQYTIQQVPGILYDWVNPDAPTQPVAPAQPMITHQTIQAEQAVGDDIEPGNYEQPQQQIQQGGMDEFHQAQQQQQQGREQWRQQQTPQQLVPPIDPSMQARLQAGFKTDTQGGQQ